MGDSYSIRDLLEERKDVYGDTWRLAGHIIRELALEDPDIFNGIMRTTPFMHNWVMMLSKLIRLLYSPTHRDSLADIEGYANLWREFLNAELNPPPSPGMRATIITQGKVADHGTP